MTPQKLLVEDNRQIVQQQIERGVIVCPLTKKKLIAHHSEYLTTEDGVNIYRLLYGQVPALITDEKLVSEYAKSSQKMASEYTLKHLESQDRWFNRLRRHDYRTAESIKAQQAIFENLPRNAVCISIGGGPSRADHRLLNINIGAFPNVDIVADAHILPYADNSVDAIYCEAVFEHLHTPTDAAKEIYRVLKRGGRSYICTPFLQAYHGYPHHYQNFTLTGHVNLFEKAGLKIEKFGTCVGPVYALRHMVAAFISTYIPSPINKIFRALWEIVSLAIAPLDIIVGRRKNSHVLASTTYLLAVKL